MSDILFRPQIVNATVPTKMYSFTSTEYILIYAGIFWVKQCTQNIYIIVSEIDLCLYDSSRMWPIRLNWLVAVTMDVVFAKKFFIPGEYILEWKTPYD